MQAADGQVLPRRPQGSVNAAAIALTALVAGLGLNAALALERGSLPKLEGVAAIFSSVALASCATSAYLLLVRARSLGEGRTRWMAAAMAVTTVALLLEVAGFASLVPGTGGSALSANGRAMIYVTWHCLIVLSALGAVLRPSAGRVTRWALPLMALGALAVVTLGPRVAPLMVSADGSFTSPYRVLLASLTLLSFSVTILWAARTGRRTSWIEAWITVSLAFGTWDLFMESLAEAPFTQFWWAGVIMRLLQFLVLAVGLLRGFASLFHALERHQASVAEFLEQELQRAREERTVRDHEGSRHSEVRDRITRIIQGGGPRMVFQPIVDLRDGGHVAVEALARFDAQPDRTPDIWFREAAMVGLSVDLELEAIRAALDRAADLPGHVLMAVNVSPDTALTAAFARTLGVAAPERVVVELTEHARIDDYEGLNRALAGLRERGVRLAVDDAGAGFASLRHIIRLGPDIIKLDVSLTRDVHMDPVRRALASSLIRFADEIEAQIIAEGVETEAEVDALRSLGVRYGQGFFFARPGPLLVAAWSAEPDAVPRPPAIPVRRAAADAPGRLAARSLSG